MTFGTSAFYRRCDTGFGFLHDSPTFPIYVCKIVVPDMDRDQEGSSTNTCDLCSLSGQLKGKDSGEDPIEKLLRIAEVVYLPWGRTEEPVKCENLTCQELWDKLEKFVDVDWSSKKSSLINLSSKPDEAENKVKEAIR